IDLVAESRLYPQSFGEKTHEETRRKIAQSLRAKRSLVILGKSGTGKSSAVRAFARDIGLGLIRGIPRTTQIFEVKMSSFASGTKFTGMIEKRIATMIAAARELGCFFFIDELHSMSGIGTSSTQENDITQYLKGPIEAGELALIGTDTYAEFYQAFGKDPAFLERFDQIQLPALEGETLEEVIRTRMMREFSFPLTQEIIRTAIDLSTEYDLTSSQPRAAVNLLRGALSSIEDGDGEREVLSPATLRQAASDRYHLRSDQFDYKERRRNLSQLKEGMDLEIVSQEEAKTALMSVWKRKISGVGDPNHVNSVLLVGAPGVGKSHLAALSADRMGYKRHIIEMNKFERGDIEEFRREVYNALLKSPFQVLIFDEIEKAHITVQESALKMLQDGAFTVTERLSHGGILTQEVNAKKALFILTSNAASDWIENQSKRAEGLSFAELKKELEAGGISKAILSRILHIVPMTRPSEREFQSAVRFYLKQTLDRESQKHHLQFHLTNEAEFFDYVFSGYSSGLDYRDAKHSLFSVEEGIADALIESEFEPGAEVKLTWKKPKTKNKQKPGYEPWQSMYN
ncbi:MAG: AAA family ATPase, partial [Bdellovibrionia bacterium]